MALSISLCRSRFSCLCSNFKRWCWGDRSCTSSVPIVHQHAPHPATFLRLPLVVSLAASASDLVMVAQGLPRLAVAPVESPTLVEPMSRAREEPAPVIPGADGASQGTASIEVDGVGP
jgi:hypothetical protein